MHCFGRRPRVAWGHLDDRRASRTATDSGSGSRRMEVIGEADRLYVGRRRCRFCVSIGAAAAQPKAGETAAQPKTILFLHSYGLNVQPWAAWSREIQTELNRQSPWPLVIQEQPLVSAGASDTTEAKFVEYLATALCATTTRFDRRCWYACGSLRPAAQDRPVSDNADAACRSRRAPG